MHGNDEVAGKERKLMELVTGSMEATMRVSVRAL
jgi:hypothetical protein